MFRPGKLTACECLPKKVCAILTPIDAILFFKIGTLADRARGFEILEIALYGAFKIARFVDDLARQLANLKHELIVLHISTLDLFEPGFPFSSEFPGEQRDEIPMLRRSVINEMPLRESAKALAPGERYSRP